jgi:hypothetical protein
MADVSTSDRPPSKVRDEVILEAQRLEESTRDSSKGHHCAAEGWSKRGHQLGIPILDPKGNEKPWCSLQSLKWG